MVLVLRLALSVFAAMCFVLGYGFLTDPVEAGAYFGVEAINNQGLSSIRGDFTAFFLVSGGSMLLGAWRSNAVLLYVAAALMGIVLAGRTLSLAIDGTFEGFYVPMTAEALMVITSLVAAKILPQAAR